MLKKFLKNFKEQNLKTCSYMSNDPGFKSNFLNKLSKNALKMYEHKKDVEKFTKLALSESDTLLDEERINNLLLNDLIPDTLKPIEIEELASNPKLIEDLGE